MLLLPGEINHLGRFGFSNLMAENPTNTDALLVNMEHHPRGILYIHTKEALEAKDDELHRRVIVI